MLQTINNNIIKILGIDSLPIEKQKEAIERLGAIVYQETMLRVLDILSEEDKDAFQALIEKNPDPETLFSFLSEKVPTLDTIVNEEAEKLRTEAGSIMELVG